MLHMAMLSMSFACTTVLSRQGFLLIDGNRYYCLSILDKHHRPNINLEQGLKILEMCTDELKRRMPIDFKGVRLLTRQQSNA